MSTGVLMAVGIIATFVTFGFGRFAYGALLPSMRQDLDMSYTAAGALSTANLVAYLAGSQVARLLLQRVPATRLITLAVTATAVVLLGLASIDRFLLALPLMMALGVLSAVAWVSLIQLIKAEAPMATRGRVIGTASLGAAWGIPVVGLIVVLAGAGHWRLAWAAMAVVSTAGLLWTVATLRASGSTEPEAVTRRPWGPDLRHVRVQKLLGAYFLYGVWFAVFATFVVSYLEDGGLSAGGSTGVWSILGLFAGVGTLVLGRAVDRFGPRRTGVLALGLAAAFAAALGGADSWVRFVLTALIGLPLVGTGTVMMVFASSIFRAADASTRLVSVSTTANAFGQAVGPVVAGRVIDATDSFAMAFGFAAACGAVAALLVGRMPDRGVEPLL
jgi:predicted MFS family arabinose efflux permease